MGSSGDAFESVREKARVPPRRPERQPSVVKIV
jgi:hypothetical protein